MTLKHKRLLGIILNGLDTKAHRGKKENDPLFSWYYLSKTMSEFYTKQTMSFGETAGLVVIIKEEMLQYY